MLQLSVLYEVIGEFWEIDPYNAICKLELVLYLVQNVENRLGKSQAAIYL